MEQTNQLLQTISEAGAIRPDERADMWKDAAPVVEIIRVRVPEQLQAPTQSGSTDMKTIRLQRVGMRSVINMNHRVVEICDYTIGMIKNMAYKEKELETAWHTRVGIDERFAVEIGYDVAEGGRFPASMRTTRTSNRLSYRVVDEMRRQLEGMGADELVEALKRSCIGVDVTDPHAAVSLYLQGGMLDSAAIREIIDLADGAGSRKYGRKGRTIWLLGVVQKTVAEAEEVVRRGDRQAIAMEAGAMAQSLKRWIVAWMEAHPAKGQETEQDLQLILQLEKIVEPLARIQVDKSKLIEYAREIVSSIKEHNECDGLIQAYERELAGRSDTARRLFERLEARKRAAMAEAERARVERS
jgi:hypothetical protein